MSLQEHIARVIQILPTDCRIKKAQKNYQREKMLIAVMKQFNAGVEEIKVEFGIYKLKINRSQVYG